VSKGVARALSRIRLAISSPVGFKHPARRLPEFAGDQVAGDRRVRAVDVDHGRSKALFAANHEAASVVGNEVAARGCAEEMLFGNAAHRRVDIDIGVMVARFAVRQREAAGAEDQNPAVTKAQFVEQEVRMCRM
jgi:hypothetical protein